MTGDIQEYYSVAENCYADLGEARKAFAATTTRDQFEQMEKTVGIMYLYCPPECKVAALSTLQEATMRKPYFHWYCECDE